MRVTRPFLQHSEHLIIDSRLDFLGVFLSFRSKNTKILTIATPASLCVLPVAVKPLLRKMFTASNEGNYLTTSATLWAGDSQ